MKETDNKDDKKEENLNSEDKVKKIVKKSMITTAVFSFLVILFSLGCFLTTYNNAAKPIIYIYPEKEQEVKVKLLDKDLLTCLYPKYESGWDVIASPNGDLIDLNTGNKLYSLYYESKNKNSYKMEKDGFCVKKEDIVSFLEEKLEILGLNYKEKEEFIIYWLPQLEKHDYVYIRFANEEEISNNMGIEIEPKPDTSIRIMMTWKGLEKPVDVEEQKLERANRTGYTIVEWGGTEI